MALTPEEFNELTEISNDVEDCRSQIERVIERINKMLDVPSPVKLNTAVHRYYTKGPWPTADFYDMQRYEGLINAPRPAGEMYIYATTARCKGDVEGYRQLIRPGQVPDAWCAHNANGSICHRTKNNDDLLNLSNASLVAAAVSNMVSECRKYSAAGVYLDEVDETWVWGYPGTTPKEYPNVIYWQSAVANFVFVLGKKLRENGFKLWINLGGDDRTFVDSVVTDSDGVNSEFFIGRDGVSMPPATGEDWVMSTQHVSRIEVSQGLDRPLHAHCSSTNLSVVNYAFLSWLMCTEFKGSFCASLDYSGAVVLPSASHRENAAKLGKPLGAMGTVSSGYMRRFEHGNVYVNANTSNMGNLPPMSGRIELL